MKFLLYSIVCFVTSCVSSWTLNDLYKQYVDSEKITKNKHRHAKRGDISHSSWSDKAASPGEYEVQTYDVRPVKKIVTPKSKETFQHLTGVRKSEPIRTPERDLTYSIIKPTQGISKFYHSEGKAYHVSESSLNGKYAEKKHQVSAWSDWSPDSAGDHLHVSKQQSSPTTYSNIPSSKYASSRYNADEQHDIEKLPASHSSLRTSLLHSRNDVSKSEHPTTYTKKLPFSSTPKSTVESTKPSEEISSAKRRNTTKTTESSVKRNHGTFKEKFPSEHIFQNPAPTVHVQCHPSATVLCPTSPLIIEHHTLKFKEEKPEIIRNKENEQQKEEGQVIKALHTAQEILNNHLIVKENSQKENNSNKNTTSMEKTIKEYNKHSENARLDNDFSVKEFRHGGSTEVETKDELRASVLSSTPHERKEISELPEIHGIISGNFNHQTFKFRDCHIDATSSVCGTDLKVNPNTCGGKASFTAVMSRVLPNTDLAAPSNDLIVHGKFDVTNFSIDRCQGRVSFGLICRELLDIIPNKLRIGRGQLTLNFSYEQQPKSISNFFIKVSGILDLDYRNRRLDVNIEKPFGSTLFAINMATSDLEMAQFTKLFTDLEIPQQDLPPDLSTLVSSSLRNPRITGLYDNSGAFEFIASAKSPASIFPSQPMVYLIIQKPRLGKVVSGLIASFESAMYRSFLSSILNLDLSNIPLFSDIKTDMAIGVSPDGLFVVKDENFNKEVGALFNSGRTIRKGLTVKAKLPMQKIIAESFRGHSNQTFPDVTLINMEVKNNKIHMDFPDDLRIALAGIPELFSQRGQEMSFPRDTMSLGETALQVKSYDIDNVDKKSLSVLFSAPLSMRLGSLMVLTDVEATLTRDELSKWNFVAKGDCKLGNTSVPVSLLSDHKQYVISSKPSSIRSGYLVNLLDKKKNYLTTDLRKYHLDDFVIEDFKVSGTLSRRNIIRFAGKPAIFGVDEGLIEFVATEESDKEDAVAMGVLFKDVDLDNVFGRMLDKKIQRRSWANGVNIGLIVSPPNHPVDFQFESDGLARTKIQPGVHLRALIQRPEFSSCKGDSLCKVLSSEMPHGSAFHLDGGIQNGELKLSAAVDGTLYMSKSFEMKDVTFHADVVDNGVQFYVFGSMNPRGVDIPFSGDMRVDNTGQLKLNMISQNNWEEPFGLNNVHLDNCSLSAAFEPGLPLPIFDMNGRMVMGKNAEDGRGIEALANVKLNLQDPSKNSFRAKIKDLSFDKLASAFGTKQPLLRFQSESQFTDEAVVSFEQLNKDNDDVEIGEKRDLNSSAFRYKGELKINGRMKLLGENADYTIKFLQQQTQLLIEVWLPDIGVNQGLLTVRAGLKQRSGTETKVSNGPTLLIRMDPLTNSAVVVGKVSTLGFSRISAIKVADQGFSSTTFATLPGNINTNISLNSPYQDNIQNADFQVTACLPIHDNVKNSLFKVLRNTATQTKKTLISAEERVTTTEKIYETTKSMIEKYKKRSMDLTSDIRNMADTMRKLRNGIKRHCVKDCGDSCMGLPGWKKSGISLGGRNAIGAPTWESCRHKIPDLNCITRCLGRKVIENVKANNKQSELQKVMGTLAETKRSLQDARSLVNRARNLVDSTLDGLEKVNKEIRVGVDISKFLNDIKADRSVNVTGVCFKDSLENAERSLVKLFVNGTFNTDMKSFALQAALDGNIDQNIAEGIADNLYPGYFEFSKKLEQVKVLLSNLDGERQDITKEIDKTSDETTQAEQKSQVVWNAEEDEFRKLAFGELPRFTLSDDETIHAFEEKSIWQIAPTNDPLFDKAPGDNQIISNKGMDALSFIKEVDKKTSCSQLRSSVNRYSDIINPLSEFTEDFLQEKIMFYRQKNRRLADLRMIDDQIKSDCFLENCTMEDMDNALSYLGRARDGTLKWAGVIDNQIEEQNKVALSYFSKRAEEIIKVDNGVSLRQYISKVKEVAQNAIKKSEVIMHKAETDDKIMKLAKELHSLLIGVKSSEELSKVAPKIFGMKRQIQSLKRNKITCNDNPVPPKKSSSEIIESKLRAIETRRINAMKGRSTTITPTKKDTQPTKDEKTLRLTPTDPPQLYLKSETEGKKELAEHSLNSFDKQDRTVLTETSEQSNQQQPSPEYSPKPSENIGRYYINREGQPTSNQYSPFTYWNNYIK